MPILTYKERSVFVDPVSYAEALQAAKNPFSLPPAFAPASRIRFRMGWPLGAPVQDPARSVELAEGVWPVGLLPLNTQIWVELDEEHPYSPVAPTASFASEPVTEPFVSSSQTGSGLKGQAIQAVAPETAPEALEPEISHISRLAPSPSPSPFLSKVSSRIEDADGNLLFRVPLADEGEDGFTVAAVLLSVSRVLYEKRENLAIQMAGECFTMENGEEPWDRSKGNVGRVLRTSDVVLVEVVCDQNTDADKHSDGCVEKQGHFKLDFPPTATIFDLRQRLTTNDGAFPCGRSIEIFCQQQSSEHSADPEEPLHDLVRLHSVRQNDADSPWIRLHAKEQRFSGGSGKDSMEKEQEIRHILSRMLFETAVEEAAYVPNYVPPRW